MPLATSDNNDKNSFAVKITTTEESDDITSQTVQEFPDYASINDIQLSSPTNLEMDRVTATTDNNMLHTNRPNDDEKTTPQNELDGNAVGDNNNANIKAESTNEVVDITTNKEPESNHPFIRYFRRLRRIYELDLKILDQIATLLDGISDEVLPQIAQVLEPLLISQTMNMLDLGQILGYVAQTIHSSTFQLGASTSLGGLNFLKFGKV